MKNSKGSIMYYLFFASNNKTGAKIAGSIFNKYRNKGIGKALIVELEKIAIDKSCTQIILVTETDRVDACKFYESAGYSPTKNKGFKKKL